MLKFYFITDNNIFNLQVNIFSICQQVDQFFKYVDDVQSQYQSNNILVTMGDDFNYQVANMWYKNLDKLIL